MARLGKRKASVQQAEAPVLSEIEIRRLERIEEINARIKEKNFAHRFLIRPSSHEEPVVAGEKNVVQEEEAEEPDEEQQLPMFQDGQDADGEEQQHAGLQAEEEAEEEGEEEDDDATEDDNSGDESGTNDDLGSEGSEGGEDGEDWRKADQKQKLWDVLNKFFNIDPLCKDWVMRSAGKKWRDFKSMLKKEHFKEELSLEENIANGCRRRVPHSDWVALCEYWNFASTKEKARKNKENRANQKKCKAYFWIKVFCQGEVRRGEISWSSNYES